LKKKQRNEFIKSSFEQESVLNSSSTYLSSAHEYFHTTPSSAHEYFHTTPSSAHEYFHTTPSSAHEYFHPHYPLRGGETGLNRGRFRPATGESGLMTFGLRSSTTYSITSFEVEAAATELGGGRGHLEG